MWHDDALNGVLRDPEVGRIAAAFERAGYDVFLVGGSVRDALLRRRHTDLDFTTRARPSVIESIVRPLASAMWTVGREFGTIAAEIGDHTVEITTFRREIYVHESRKPQVSFGDDVHEDLRRRDFTVNAMAVSVHDGHVVDPFGGRDDLASRRLRTPGPPEQSFREDPLRMLRACRFVSQLSADPDDTVTGAIRTLRERLGIVSAERVRDELAKILLLDDPGRALVLLVQTRLSDEFLPELCRLDEVEDRHLDPPGLLDHTIGVTRAVPRELTLRLTALVHALGRGQGRGGSAGAATTARTRLSLLRFPGRLVGDVARLVSLQDRPFRPEDAAWPDAAVRRYVHEVGSLRSTLHTFLRVDCAYRTEESGEWRLAGLDRLEERVEELSGAERLDEMTSALDGAQVMEHLGIGSGPEVGEALRHLMDVRLDEGVVSGDDARERLDAWWRQRTP